LISLYIHIPFCDSPARNGKCDYCDFFSESVKNYNKNFLKHYIYALVNDIKQQIEFFKIKEIPTVYIGGGTPSVLGEQIGILFDELKKINLILNQSEFTIEVNPESLNREFISICLQGGVNRISLGVQTFNEVSRNAVNRFGNKKTIMDALKLIKDFPIKLSVDLITGLPYSNIITIKEDIKCLLDYSPDHISLYNLTIEEGTPLAKNIKKKKVKQPDTDLCDTLWITGKEMLLEAGFIHYEVSNFALQDNFCRHNIRYWQMNNWIGVGPAASGTIINENTGTGKRYTYKPDIKTYLKEPSIKNAECEELDKIALIKESFLMGYRFFKGPDPRLFLKRFDCSINDIIPQTLKKWEEKDKMLFLNSFLSDAFTELDKHS